MRRLLTAAFTAIAALTLAACGSDDNPDPARLRVLHASPDAPAVDVYLDGAKIVSNLPYKGGTAFDSVGSGPRNITVNAAGTSTTVINVTPALSSNSAYTVIAVNELAKIEPLLVEDTGAPEAGKARVRVVHAAPKAPAVDIYVTAPGASLGSTAPTLANVPFKAVSSPLSVNGGNYQIRVTAAGSKDALYDSGTVAVATGADLMLVAVQQNVGLSPISLVGLSANPGTPVFELPDNRAELRVMHASPDAPNVDVLVDGSVVLANVPYPAASPYLPLPAGTYNVKVNAAGTTTTVIDADLAVAGSKAYTAIATGFLASIEPLVLADDLAPPPAGQAKIRVVHASPDAPNVDVYANDAKILSNVPFRAASDYLKVPAGAYRVDVRIANSNVVALSADVNLAAGKIYTAVATGSAIPGGVQPLALQLLTDR
jgi:hypothetical protein